LPEPGYPHVQCKGVCFRLDFQEVFFFLFLHRCCLCSPNLLLGQFISLSNLYLL
jgi:hypothetical protein